MHDRGVFLLLTPSSPDKFVWFCATIHKIVCYFIDIIKSLGDDACLIGLFLLPYKRKLVIPDNF